MKALLFAIALLFGAPAMALTGLDFMKTCNSPNPSLCIGYVAGMLDAHGVMLAKGDEIYCAPATVTVDQALLVIKKWMAENPNRLHESQAFTYLNAMVANFPCKR